MKFVVLYRRIALFSFLGSCLAVNLSVCASDDAPKADEIVQKAVARAAHPENAIGESYTYRKLTVTEELDPSGKVKERKEKVYQVYFQAGVTRLKLLEVNGRPPGESDRKKQAETELNVRQLLGESKNDHGSHDNFLTPELAARFEFTVLGRDKINGRESYQLHFQPKNPEPPVHHLIDRLLNEISGTIWVDAEEFEVARAEVYLRSEVNLLGGVAGCLKKLAYTMNRTRLAEGLWFSTSSSGDFEGRKLLDSTRIKTKSQATNFRRVS